jgi:hypothetical protein
MTAFHDPHTFESESQKTRSLTEEEIAMGETEDRKREARETDQEISDRQRQAVADDREARRVRLEGQSQTPVGGNLPGELDLVNGGSKNEQEQ